jgi:hypothetical protein
LGLGLHAFNDTYKFLPPLGPNPNGPGVGNNPATATYAINNSSSQFTTGKFAGFTGYTTFVFLLPFIEADNNAPTNKNISGLKGGLSGYSNVVIKTYLCPAGTYNGEGIAKYNSPTYSYGDYAANFYVFGNPSQPGNIPHSNCCTSYNIEGAPSLPNTFVDGTSNTVMLSERYGGDCNGNGNFWWDPNNTPWCPQFCGTHLTSYPSCPMFQVKPTASVCNVNTANSYHTGGIPVCLGDGSVHLVNDTISPATWGQICDPRDGVVISQNWD